jgi:hypothetical protein
MSFGASCATPLLTYRGSTAEIRGENLESVPATLPNRPLLRRWSSLTLGTTPPNGSTLGTLRDRHVQSTVSKPSRIFRPGVLGL